MCVWGGGGGRQNFRPVRQVFSPCFGGKNNTGTSFHITQVGLEIWVDSDILENFTRNGGYVIVARSLSIVISLILL